MKRIPIYIIAFLAHVFGAFSQMSSQELIEEINNSKIKDERYVDLCNQLGNLLLKTDPPSSFSYINEALRVADSLQYQSGLFSATIDKGSSFWVVGLYDMALKFYLQADALSIPTISLDQSRLYNNIAETYKKLGNTDSALLYYKKSEIIMNQMDTMVYPAMLYVNKAELYITLGLVDSARIYFEKGLANGEKIGHLRAIGYALAGQAEILQLDQQYNSAFEKMHQSLKVLKSINDQRAIIQGYQQISMLASQLHFDQLCQAYLDSAYTLAKRHQALDLLAEIYYRRYELGVIKASYQDAIMSLNDYRILTDSLNRISASERLKNIKSALESEIAIKELDLLREQQIVQKEQILRQNILFVSAIILALVILIFAIFYYRSLRRERKNSAHLNELNELIKSKNSEIALINKNLDQKLIKTNKMLVEGQKTAQLGSWEFDPRSGQIDWTEETWRQLGYKISNDRPDISILKKVLSKHQQVMLSRTFKEVIEKKKESSTQIILPGLHPDESKVLSLHIIPEIENNKVVRIYGSSLDITERVSSELKERRIIKILLDLGKSTYQKSTNYENFVKKLLTGASEILNVDRSSLWHYYPDDKMLQCFTLFDSNQQEFIKGDILYEKDYPIYFNALYQNRAIDADDIVNDPRTCEFSTSYQKQTSVVALLDAKVHIENKMIGVLCFERKQHRSQWSLSDQRFAGSLADILAVAYTNQQNQLLEREKLDLIKQLLKKNQNLQQFAYVISHNLRGPSAQMIGLTELYKSSGSESMKTTIIEKIQEASKNMDEVIKDLASLIKQQDDGQIEKENITMQEILEKVLYELDPIIKATNPELIINYEPPIRVFTNRNIINDIIKQLLTNAFKFKNPEERAKVELTCKIDSDQLVVQIKDNGLGIDLMKYGHKLFQMYQRLHLDIPGRGIGLYIAKNQAELIGGTININSTPGKGTNVELTLPINSNNEKSNKFPDLIS